VAGRRMWVPGSQWQIGNSEGCNWSNRSEPACCWARSCLAASGRVACTNGKSFAPADAFPSPVICNSLLVLMGAAGVYIAA
jgi:hypothetical protein